MTVSLSPVDAELDGRWRAAFNEPLPMLGSPEIARAILDAHDGAAIERRLTTGIEPVPLKIDKRTEP